MATAPNRVRTALQRVTGTALEELRAVTAAAPKDAAVWRAVMFETVPLVVSEYSPAAAALGLDWFDEIRADANPAQAFTPTARLTVTDDDVAAMIARVTASIHKMETGLQPEVDSIVTDSAKALEAETQKYVAAGFRDTITENAKDDPAAKGWQRFARHGACKFCLMLAERGAVYTRATANFAAHTHCHCVAGPSYDANAPRASALQYVASSKRSKDPLIQMGRNQRVRDYLNHNFPDAHG